MKGMHACISLFMLQTSPSPMAIPSSQTPIPPICSFDDSSPRFLICFFTFLPQAASIKCLSFSSLSALHIYSPLSLSLSLLTLAMDRETTLVMVAGLMFCLFVRNLNHPAGGHIAAATQPHAFENYLLANLVGGMSSIFTVVVLVVTAGSPERRGAGFATLVGISGASLAYVMYMALVLAPPPSTGVEWGRRG